MTVQIEYSRGDEDTTCNYKKIELDTTNMTTSLA